jgi:hypothetical protein
METHCIPLQKKYPGVSTEDLKNGTVLVGNNIPE